MRTGSYFIATFNYLFRNEASRCASRHTTPWGLTRLAARSTTLKDKVIDNIANRIITGKLSLKDKFNLPDSLFVAGSEKAIELVKDDPERSYSAVKTLVGFAVELVDGGLFKEIAPLITKNTELHCLAAHFLEPYLYSSKGIFDSEMTSSATATCELYYERKHAREILNKITEVSHNLLLREEIESLLRNAPSYITKYGKPDD